MILAVIIILNEFMELTKRKFEIISTKKESNTDNNLV